MKVYRQDIGEVLESLYRKYHHPEYIHPDPLECLKGYTHPGDREIAGIIASSLATGRVQSILTAVRSVLEKLPSPRETLLSLELRDLRKTFKNFKYRFYTSSQFMDFLFGIRACLREYGSLNECFISGMKKKDQNVIPALGSFVKSLDAQNRGKSGVLPLPERGSACKRLNLFLRWMVREDEVDPGGWEGVSTNKLIVPVDTHMLRIAQALGLTSRKQADMKTAVEITEAMKSFDPEDPVRYDFSITRLGIHPDLTYGELGFKRIKTSSLEC